MEPNLLIQSCLVKLKIKAELANMSLQPCIVNGF